MNIHGNSDKINRSFSVFLIGAVYFLFGLKFLLQLIDSVTHFLSLFHKLVQIIWEIVPLQFCLIAFNDLPVSDVA